MMSPLLRSFALGVYEHSKKYEVAQQSFKINSTQTPHLPTYCPAQGPATPEGGLTAFLSATEETLQRVAARTTTRKIIVAMTDGFDNSSQINESQLIDAANAENIPIFTIGFGQFSDNDVLQQIADETGGSFFLAEGADITAAFQSIGTNVQFFYTADLSQNLTAPFDLMLNLNFNSLNTSRNLTQN